MIQCLPIKDDSTMALHFTCGTFTERTAAVRSPAVSSSSPLFDYA